MNLSLRRPAPATAAVASDGRPVTAEGAAARERRLTRTLDSARGRLRLAGDGTLMAVGGALAAIGIVAVLAGWAGASHTVLVAGQIPYLISGGLLGLGLIFLGGFLYFGYWLAMLVRNGERRDQEARRDATRLLAALEETNRHLMTLLDRGLPNGAGSRQRQSDGNGSANTGAGRAGSPFVATASGSMFHRPDCPVVNGRPNLRRVDPDREEGLAPCGICDPLGERAGTS